MAHSASLRTQPGSAETVAHFLKPGDVVLSRGGDGRWSAKVVGYTYRTDGWENMVDAVNGICMVMLRARWAQEDRRSDATRTARREAGIPWWNFWSDAAALPAAAPGTQPQSGEVNPNLPDMEKPCG